MPGPLEGLRVVDCSAIIAGPIATAFLATYGARVDKLEPLGTHLLQQGLVDSTRSKHVADVLARNTREQTVLLDEFVDDGRAILGVLKLDAIGLRIDDLIARALERAAPVASLHGVSFAPQTDARDVEVDGDERRLQRLVYRLLVAVVRRTREAGVVEVSATPENGVALLCSSCKSAGTLSKDTVSSAAFAGAVELFTQ